MNNAENDVFSKEWFARFRKDAQAALKEVAEKQGFDVEAGNIRYTPGLDFTMQVRFVKQAAEGFDPKREEWNKFCKFFGLTEDMYHKEIRISGDTFVIAGIKPKAKRNAVIIRKGNGAEYVASPETVRSALGLEGVEVKEDQELEWKQYAFMLGLKEVPFGAEFVVRGETFVISGCSPAASKYPVLAKSKLNGKTYKFPVSDVKAYFDSLNTPGERKE